jgi:ABC-2 type transport system ATP-binding protein/lipopolysaccharide transport system ATP-binding protein
MIKGQSGYEELWALREITFSVHAGEFFAVIGTNGAGKSTLMKTLARVVVPTRGRVVIEGVIAPMINLGAGFNMEMTGYENVLLNGVLLGRTVSEMRKQTDSIADWAELSDFMDVPVRNYSSGMLARLGFAIAIDTDPDVLLIDEVLAVGDEGFQQKCLARMGALRDRGVTIVLVTHSMGQVKEHADRAIWLDHGHVKLVGTADEVVNEYRARV